MSRRRYTLAEVRERVLADIADGEWVTPNQVRQRLGIGGACAHWRVAVVLERLAADGELELKPGTTRHRYFKRGDA